RDAARHGEHRREVGRSVLVLGRADRDEAHAALLHRVRQIGREGEATLRDVAADELLQAPLVGPHLAATAPFRLPRDLGRAHDVVAALREAGACHEPDVAGPNYAELHGFSALQTASLDVNANARPSRSAAARARRAPRARGKSVSLETRDTCA